MAEDHFRLRKKFKESVEALCQSEIEYRTNLARMRAASRASFHTENDKQMRRTLANSMAKKENTADVELSFEDVWFQGDASCGIEHQLNFSFTIVLSNAESGDLPGILYAEAVRVRRGFVVAYGSELDSGFETVLTSFIQKILEERMEMFGLWI